MNDGAPAASPPLSEPPRRRGERKRDRMVAQGRSSDDGSRCTRLVVHENDGSWSFHGLGAPGVKISQPDATLAQGICADRPWGVLCLPCAIGATADLADPGRMGMAL